MYIRPDERLLRQLRSKEPSDRTHAQLLREHFEGLTSRWRYTVVTPPLHSRLKASPAGGVWNSVWITCELRVNYKHV